MFRRGRCPSSARCRHNDSQEISFRFACRWAGRWRASAPTVIICSFITPNFVFSFLKFFEGAETFSQKSFCVVSFKLRFSGELGEQTKAVAMQQPLFVLYGNLEYSLFNCGGCVADAGYSGFGWRPLCGSAADHRHWENHKKEVKPQVWGVYPCCGYDSAACLYGGCDVQRYFCDF